MVAGDVVESVDHHGFAIVSDVVPATEIEYLASCVDAAANPASVRRSGEVFAIRNLLDVVPAVAALANAPGIRALIEPVLGKAAFAVRGLFFDKTAQAN